MSKIHEALAPISWLEGRWSTTDGRGYYPNIPDFTYHEDLEFLCIGQPMYNFLSTSRHPEKQTPMHQERGFLRIKPGTNELSFVVSHNFGLTSLEEGLCETETHQVALPATERPECKTKSRSKRQRRCRANQTHNRDSSDNFSGKRVRAQQRCDRN